MRWIAQNRFSKKELARRTAVVFTAHVGYALAFSQLYPSVGDAVGAVSIVPTAVAGWLLGLRYGLLAGLFTFILNEALYGIFSTTTTPLSVQSIPGFVFSLASSGIVGLLSDLLFRTRSQARQIEQQSEALTQEIARRIDIETELIKARDEALAASHAKTRLLAKVSHELRTPLGAILGYAEMLEEGVWGQLNSQQKGITVEMIDSSHTLNRLIGELLDIAQVQSASVKLDNSPFDIRTVAQKVHSQMALSAKAKGLIFQTYVDPELPDMIMGDQHRVWQVIINLVGNAIKFTLKGEVQLCLERVQPHSWRIRVSDTGPGIPKELQDVVFEPFQQIDDSVTRRHKGVGLGLAIVKQLTQAMDGQITLESEMGQGSVFTVLLPLNGVS